MSAGLWSGLVGPKELPDPIAKTLQDAFTKAAETRRVRDALVAINAEPPMHAPGRIHADHPARDGHVRANGCQWA